MAFVQIIQFKTSKIDEMRALGDELEKTMGGDSKAKRVVVAADRDNEGQYLNIVFFDSYEEAMANSSDPRTQEFSSKMMELGDGPPTFVNLDVVEDRTP
jgi:DNA topoisomerase IA